MRARYSDLLRVGGAIEWTMIAYSIWVICDLKDAHGHSINPVQVGSRTHVHNIEIQSTHAYSVGPIKTCSHNTSAELPILVNQELSVRTFFDSRLLPPHIRLQRISLSPDGVLTYDIYRFEKRIGSLEVKPGKGGLERFKTDVPEGINWSTEDIVRRAFEIQLGLGGMPEGYQATAPVGIPTSDRVSIDTSKYGAAPPSTFDSVDRIAELMSTIGHIKYKGEPVFYVTPDGYRAGDWMRVKQIGGSLLKDTLRLATQPTHEVMDLKDSRLSPELIKAVLHAVAINVEDGRLLVVRLPSPADSPHAPIDFDEATKGTSWAKHTVEENDIVILKNVPTKGELSGPQAPRLPE